jgi:hypothetical protein
MKFTAVVATAQRKGREMKCRSRRSYASFMVAENRNPICRRTHDREHRARRRPRAWDDGEGRSREHQKSQRSWEAYQISRSLWLQRYQLPSGPDGAARLRNSLVATRR